MSAYLDVRVKWNCFGMMSKAGVSMLESLDPNYFVRLYIDSTTEYTKLHASKKVHHIPVEPGAHTIIITRREIGKTTFSDVCNVAVGGVLGAALGCSSAVRYWRWTGSGEAGRPHCRRCSRRRC